MRILFIGGVLALVAGCGAALTPAGSTCKADPECSAGSTCLDFAVQPADGGTCGTSTKTCSKTCTAAADCGGLQSGSIFKCEKTCGTLSYCVRTSG